jgi:hypothetical protein
MSTAVVPVVEQDRPCPARLNHIYPWWDLDRSYCGHDGRANRLQPPWPDAELCAKCYTAHVQSGNRLRART